MTARVLKRIVFGYSVDSFSGLQIVGYNQFKRMLARAGFDIAVSLAPLNDLAPDVDILFVSPNLAEPARQAAPRSRVEVLENFVNHPIYERMIQQLTDGQEWTAARLSERRSAEDGGEIVRYRGYERIE